MSETAIEILNESTPTNVNYLDMKKLLSDFSVFIVIPGMTKTIMVVLFLIATMAFQSEYGLKMTTSPLALGAPTRPPSYLHSLRCSSPPSWSSIPFTHISSYLCDYVHGRHGCGAASYRDHLLQWMAAITPDELWWGLCIDNTILVLMLSYYVFYTGLLSAVGDAHPFQSPSLIPNLNVCMLPS